MEEVKIIKATHEGKLDIGDNSVDCAVLENGTRVLTASAVFKALDRPRKGKSKDSYRVDHMPSFLNANNLQPFISEDFLSITDLIYFKGINGATKSGYDGKILRGICKVYMDARKANALHFTQENIANLCEDLLYALADIGINSLVDNATGYDKFKEDTKTAVGRFLEKHLQLEPTKWTKAFSDEFFEGIFKMKNWDWTNISKKPSVVGHYINNFVYSRISPNLLTELKKANPKIGKGRKHNHHQHLTPEHGNATLKEHIAGLVALTKASGHDWDKFLEMVEAAYPKLPQNLEIDYDIRQLEDGQSKKQLSEFDKNMTKALNFNPKKA